MYKLTVALSNACALPVTSLNEMTNQIAVSIVIHFYKIDTILSFGFKPSGKAIAMHSLLNHIVPTSSASMFCQLPPISTVKIIRNVLSRILLSLQCQSTLIVK